MGTYKLDRNKTQIDEMREKQQYLIVAVDN